MLFFLNHLLKLVVWQSLNKNTIFQFLDPDLTIHIKIKVDCVLENPNPIKLHKFYYSISPLNIMFEKSFHI